MQILFLMDILLILVFTFSVGALLHLPTKPATLVGLLILAYADIVLPAEILATFKLLDARLFLAVHALTAVIGLGVWWYSGKPSLSKLFNFNSHKLWTLCKRQPELWLLAVGVSVAYFINAILILIVPPNNWDSMTYHLSRVGYWLQQGSFYPWITHNLRQTTFPINAEIGLLWTIIFWGTDQLVGFIQWIAVILGMAAIFGLTRFLGYSRSSSVFAALIWATLPEIVLQSTTTQNDLLASAFFVTMIYLVLLGFRLNHHGSLLLSGVAMGLALGTKLTALMALPGLAVGALLLWHKNGRSGLKCLAKWGVACLGGFVLFGVYTYGLNLIVYGGPLGPPSHVESVSAGSYGVGLTLVKANVARYIYQAADLTGLPDPIKSTIQKIKADSGSAIFKALDIEPNSPRTTRKGTRFGFTSKVRTHEDLAWFGPLGFLLLIPAAIYCGAASFIKKDVYRLILVAIALSLFLAVCASLLWSPWRGRYFVMAATVCAPFLAMYYNTDSKFILLRWAIVLMAILVMGNTVVSNEAKPLTGPAAIWKLNRIGRQSLNRPPIEPTLRMVEELVPPKTTVGIIIGGDDWDYPLFGEHFSRTVVPIYPRPEIVDLEWLAEQDINFLLVKDASGAYLSRIPAGLHTIGKANEGHNEWCVLYRGDAHFSDWDPWLRKQLDKVPKDTPLLTVDQSLVGNVGAVGDLATAEWGIERASGEAFLWLGPGDQQGVKGTLWSVEKQLVGLAFDVLSGPAREDSLRTVELTLENEAGIKTERQQFDQATTLTFGVELQPGRNEFSFKSLDRATVLTQPNGDTRPLLVLLRWITVTPLLAASQAGPANYPLLTVDPSLTGAVGIDPYIKTPWPIEVYEDQSLSFLWLGHGDAEGVAGVLWSDAAREVILEFEVSPGPSREDQQRTVQLVSQNNGQVTTQRETFDGSVVLVFPVQLQPGRNDFQFTVLDEATITVHGDTRPLLVFLRQITVRSLS
jgi:hypothetical protein